MSVLFNRVPSNIRVPFFYAEVNSGLNYYAANSKHLLIGQKLSAGAAAANVPVLIQVDDIEDKFGAGSMLVDMIRTAKRNNFIGEIWALPLADPAGAAMVSTITIAGTLTPGLLVVYIAGERVAVNITSADTVTTAAAAIAAAINAGFSALDGQTYMHPVSATSALGVVTVTARHVGLVGNTIGIEKDRVGDEGPNAALITIAQNSTPGSGTPSLTSGLAALSTNEFDFISMPYADTTSLNSVRDFLSDVGGRWDPLQQLYGHCFTALNGDLSAQSTLGSGRNDPHMTVMGYEGSPTPTWVWAAAMGAIAQLHLNLGAPLSEAGEISRPLHTLVLLGVYAPTDITKRWDTSDLNTLYYDGISGYHVQRDGQVAINKLISTYQTNSWGSPDSTWLSIQTLFQTVYTLRLLRQVVTQTYGRHSLAQDNPGNVQGMATPRDIRATIGETYGSLVNAGVAKNWQLFMDNLIVEISTNPNRVNTYLPIDVVNQLDIFAVNATTFLNAAAV